MSILISIHLRRSPISAKRHGHTWISCLTVPPEESGFNYLWNPTNGQQFIGAQLAIADRMIRETVPEVIVVCSTMARMLVGIKDHLNENRWLGSPLIFDNHIGTYRWEGIPVFFSAPLYRRESLGHRILPTAEMAYSHRIAHGDRTGAGKRQRKKRTGL
jgi:hypothetical protein